jgi:hypothetical protein
MGLRYSSFICTQITEQTGGWGGGEERGVTPLSFAVLDCWADGHLVRGFLGEVPTLFVQ